VFVKLSAKSVELAEVGPRFEMKRMSSATDFIDHHTEFCPPSAYEIRQGTIEQNEAEREWVLAHYSRTAKKRKLLAGPTFANEENDSSSKRKKR
jgi:U3 small nucleolar ribonucleoprotein protein IMP4